MRHNLLSLCCIAVFASSPLLGVEIILSSDQIADPGGLKDALTTVNNNPGTDYVITIPYSTLSFPLVPDPTANLQPIATNTTLAINGPLGGCTINGQDTYRGFFVSSGNVTVNNLSLTQMLARGGDGGDGLGGAGAGMGAGGTFFVKSGTTLTLDAVTMTFSAAQGGTGGGGDGVDLAGAGGGGMGGAGGTSLDVVVGGGGGGLFGNGASGLLTGGGSGGGGLFGNGAAGGGISDSGGGGGGATGNGSPGADTAGGNGGNYSAGIPGAGGTSISPNGQAGTANIGGGGGFGDSPGGKGGKGGDNGGGGGGGASLSGDNSGGDGGMYGGGGSAGNGLGSTGIGGKGGFGGGGAGASNTLPSGGAVGGFGGGAGGNASGSGVNNTGFGGGGSGGSDFSGGTGGPFAGSGGPAIGNVGGGGGGAGLGGALFIHVDGTVIVLDETTFLGNSAIAGLGGTNVGCGGVGEDGQGLGQDIFMMASSQLTFDINDILTISSDIVGDGGLGGGSLTAGGVTKSSAGTLTFSGNNTYTGNTNIVQGTLIVTGSTGPNNKTFIQDGGILKGRGTLNDAVTVLSGGTLAPGNPKGTLSIVGPLVFNAGSHFNVQANAMLQSGIASVTGPVTLAGILTMDFDPGEYQAGQLFTILTATEDISGIFSSVGSNLTNLGLLPIYNAHTLQILLLSPPIPSNCSDQFRGNVKILSDYLDSISDIPLIQPVLSILSSLSCPELKEALKSISPGRNAFATYASQETMFSVNKVATTRMSIQRSARKTRRQNPEVAIACQAALHADADLFADTSYPHGSTTKAAAGDDGYSVWVTGLGELTHQDAQNQNPAFHTSAEGGLLGFETYQVPGMLIGLTAGYAHNDIHMDQSAGKSNVDFCFVGLYETAYISDGYIEFCLWGSYNRFHNTRNIAFPGFAATARSHHIGWQLTPYLGVGYDFGFNWGILEPFAGLDAVISVENGFAEKGAGSLNMVQADHTSEFLRFETGVNLYEAWNKPWGSIILRETVSYVLREPYRVGTVNAAIVGAPGSFTVTAFTSTQHILSPGAEIFFKHKSGAFTSLTYSGEFSFGTGFMSNELMAKLGVYF